MEPGSSLCPLVVVHCAPSTNPAIRDKVQKLDQTLAGTVWTLHRLGRVHGSSGLICSHVRIGALQKQENA